MTQAPLPAARAALVDSNGVATPAFYRFFAALHRAQNATPAELEAINKQLAALRDEINKLPAASYPRLDAVFPLDANGLLQKGYTQLTWRGTTTDVPEGDNLYYTDARVDARIAAHDTFPFFLANGSPSYIPLASDLTLPFFDTTGSAANIALAA